MKNILYIILLWSSAATAQPDPTDKVITFDQAVELAVQNNPEIRIGKVEIATAENQVTKGNAGMLPVVNALAEARYLNNFAQIDIRTFQEQMPLVELDESGVATNEVSLGVRADYAIYDGKRGKYRLELLKIQADIARQQQEALINGTILGVAQLYFEIEKLQNQEELLRENIAIGEAQVQRNRDLAEFGKATGLAVLSAQTEVNTDRSALDNIILAKENLLTDLNYLIGLAPDARYKVVTEYRDIQVPDLADIQRDISEKNPTVLLSRKGIVAATQALELTKADRLPRVGVFAQIGYFRQENDLQQLARLQTTGGTLGISASYNLYDGGARKTREQTEELKIQTAQMRVDLTETQLLNAAAKERNNLILLQSQLAREQSNVATFEDNFQRTQDRYAVGKATNLDLRTAQLALLNVRMTMTNLRTSILKSAAILDNYRGL